MLFHRCRWTEVARYFTQPAAPTRALSCSEYMSNRLFFGFTTIELRCEGCGDVKFTETHGNATKDAKNKGDV